MDKKPRGGNKKVSSRERASLLKGEMDEITRRTQDALTRSRAIIAKSKRKFASEPGAQEEIKPDA
ncbi:MAG: hypothetical protein JO094_04325 [Hyphomicrobiales bacterium]|nr:hypothetical protein [Hyphomicrobiales bacterium]MBV9753762.1 hypothetical protein [Hyphomicrobiales bacterium]